VPFDVDETTVPAPEPLAEKLPGVTAVIPAYNEELFIGSIVLKARQIVDRVIVVDDGSTDRTSELAAIAGAEVIRLDKNMGKAHALLLGLKRAQDLGSTAAVTLDGDGQHKAHEIPDVVRPVLDGKADLVIGSRFLRERQDIPAYRKMGQKTLDVFTTISSKHKCSDSQSGFRAFSKKALENLTFESNGYNIESDTITYFASKGLVIAEVPITVRYEVPHKHKKNPFAHGISVLAHIINLISYRRPLIAFGIPGFVLFVIGGITGLIVLNEYYSSTGSPFPLSLISITFLIVGLLLMIAALILNMLVIYLPKK
jgi:glycosyltransferase involved in cell wall biosynthesis